jgi:uncharacterized membrane protein YidH (DUF202 family)
MSYDRLLLGALRQLNRFRLQRDPALYAPSYAVLLGILVSSVVGLQTAQSSVVAATAQVVLGVSIFLVGIHSILYRREHTELLQGRMGLKYYRPYVFVLIGVVMMFIGLVVATFGYIRLLSPGS